MVSLVNSHTNPTSKKWHLWEIDLTFALNSTPGWPDPLYAQALMQLAPATFQLLCEGHFIDTATGIPEEPYSSPSHPEQMPGYAAPHTLALNSLSLCRSRSVSVSLALALDLSLSLSLSTSLSLCLANSRGMSRTVGGCVRWYRTPDVRRLLALPECVGNKLRRFFFFFFITRKPRVE